MNISYVPNEYGAYIYDDSGLKRILLNELYILCIHVLVSFDTHNDRAVESISLMTIYEPIWLPNRQRTRSVSSL